MRNTLLSVRLLSLVLLAAPFACKQQQQASVKEYGDGTGDPAGASTAASPLDQALDDAIDAPGEVKEGTLPIEGTEPEPQRPPLDGKTGLRLDGDDAGGGGDTTTTPSGDPAPADEPPEDDSPLKISELLQAEQTLNGGGAEASLRLSGDDDLDIQGVAALVATGDGLRDFIAKAGDGDGAATTTQPGGGGATTTGAPDNQGLAELRLTDDKAVTDLKAELANAKAALARIETKLQRLQTAAKPSGRLIQAQTQAKDPCVYDRAVKRGDKCQCRAWNLDVVGASFPVPRQNPVRGFVKATAPKCKLYEKEYCVGDATKSGSCGLFGKNVGYNTPAIATSNRVAGEKANECWLTIDKLVVDNHARVFSAPNSCGKEIAIQRGNLIEMWEYNTSTGAFVKQVTGIGPTGNIPTTTRPGSQSRLNPTSTTNPAVATTLQAFNTLCVGIQSLSGKRAEWTATMAGGGGCRCGGSSVSATTYLTSYSAADRTAFPAACREFLGR